MTPLGPDVPQSVRTLLLDITQRLSALETPNRPQRVYTNTATTLAALGVDAADYPGCSIYLTGLDTFVVSDGADWIRQDTQGALA